MPVMPDFSCADCGASFTVGAEVLGRYRGWQPRQCLRCRNAGPRRVAGAAASAGSRSKSIGGGEPAPWDPQTGLFADGACSGNPGPGGWGVVWVRNGEVLAERHGGEQRTTNNRMELRALIEAYRLLPADSEETIWSDSNLCVRTILEWAPTWERLGWKRKTGPVENLELVRELLGLARSHPGVRLRWLKGHAGQRWNEHADQLATSFQRGLA